MESLLQSLGNYYIIFIILAIIGIFAIIGYVVDKKYPKEEKKEVVIDMEAVKAKSGEGLNSTISKISSNSEVEQLDMTPTNPQDTNTQSSTSSNPTNINI